MSAVDKKRVMMALSSRAKEAIKVGLAMVIVYVHVAAFIWPRTSVGMFGDATRKLWAIQAQLFRTYWELMSGKGTAAEDLEKASLETAYAKLTTSPQGLTATEAKARIEKYGRNELIEKEVSNLEKFLRFFWGPIAWMMFN